MVNREFSFFLKPVLVLLLLTLSHCTSDPADNPGTTVSDIEGNIYNVIKIGDMTWMAENLRTTTYNDGRPIQLMEADTLWDNTALAGYCIYNNNQSYLPYYGILYNWYSVNKGTLCPDGWHVPSVEEWGRLLEYLGNDPELAGGKLKENGTTHWESPNFGASDMFGFKALPGGSRDPLGNFSSLKISAYFWSSSVQVDLLAYSVGLLSNSSFLYSNSHHKGYGFSVRCLKN